MQLSKFILLLLCPSGQVQVSWRPFALWTCTRPEGLSSMSHNISLLCPEEPPSREERIGCGLPFPTLLYIYILIFHFPGRLLESLNSQHSPSSTTVHSLRPVLPLSPEIHELPPSSDCRCHRGLARFPLIIMAILASTTKGRSIPVAHTGIERCTETADRN